jgi:hypothetical protein
MKKVFVFDCSVNSKLHGYTEDNTGANLPKAACNGKWVFIQEIEVRAGEARIALNVDEMLAAIEKDGYYLNGHTITFTETVIKPS